MVEKTAVPKVLRLAAGLLVLSWVLGRHHHFKNGEGWEHIHRRWHERMGSLLTQGQPGSPETSGETTVKDA